MVLRYYFLDFIFYYLVINDSLENIMNISSRKQLMKDAEHILNFIKEETEGVDKKVESSVKKIKELCSEKNDITSALIELSKLVEEKNYTTILNSIKDIEKATTKFKEDELFVDLHFLIKYRESIQAALIISAHQKFNNKECSLIISCF